MAATLAALSVAAALAAGPPLVSFEAMAPRHSNAAEEYRQIWDREGPRMIAALEAVTGLAYPEAPLAALVREGPSMMALDGSSMRLRAGPDAESKRALLLHELGHRLALTLPRAEGIDDHRLLYLFLHDVWSDLYGPQFAERMVQAERRSKAHYDYDGAWTWALSMSRDERQELLKTFTSRHSDRP